MSPTQCAHTAVQICPKFLVSAKPIACLMAVMGGCWNAAMGT
ncbi:MAG: hypothetical protein NTW93_08050 [Phycisphaerae bacterium]|nr:hypothetical protein [Phycisphaerae bacterium]